MSKTTMNSKLANLLADQMTHCWASERGCKKLPVRMIAEQSSEGGGLIDMVMLCVDHSVAYRPEGPVLMDETLSDANIKTLKDVYW